MPRIWTNGGSVETNRESVLAAIAECDAAGEDAFLAAHGYKPSKRYQVNYGGRKYPSKAVLGVAVGLTAGQFSGGASHTCRVLRKLGFEVSDALTAVADRLTARLVYLLPRIEYPFGPMPGNGLPVDPVAVFASGCSAPEVDGFAALGLDIGVAANHLTDSTMDALRDLQGTDIQLFVDSGAFSEVTFGPDGPRVAREITEAEWGKRLDRYFRLAGWLAGQLHVVAPDRVGDQAETLRRLRRWASEMSALHGAGVRVLLPVQKGAMTQAEFYREGCGVLGFEAMPAMPCKKAATTPAEVGDFVRAVLPQAIHFLGLGQTAADKHVCQALAAGLPESAQVQMDSNRIRANVGRRRGLRRFTAAQDLVKPFSDSVRMKKALGIMLAFGSQQDWDGWKGRQG